MSLNVYINIPVPSQWRVSFTAVIHYVYTTIHAIHALLFVISSVCVWPAWMLAQQKAMRRVGLAA